MPWGGPTRNTKKRSRSPYSRATSRFIVDLEAVRAAASHSVERSESEYQSASQTFSRLIDNITETLKQNEEAGKTVALDDIMAQIASIKKHMREVAQTARAKVIIPRSLIILLISQYDALLGDLIRAIYQTQPSQLADSQKSLGIQEILKLGSVEKAKEHLINKEVESVLRESHIDQIKWLEKKLNVKLREDLKIWPLFVEVTERRNILTHANGRIGEQYISICQSNDVKLEEDTKAGKTLHTDIDYITTAIDVLFEIGVKLAQVIERKVCPDRIEEIDSDFISLTYDLILQEKYDYAIILLEFYHKYLSRKSKGSSKLINVINLANCYKQTQQTVVSQFEI